VDRVGLIGDPEEIEQVEKIRHASGESHIESEQITEDPESDSQQPAALDDWNNMTFAIPDVGRENRQSSGII
jgi:hypothetical protein